MKNEESTKSMKKQRSATEGKANEICDNQNIFDI